MKKILLIQNVFVPLRLTKVDKDRGTFFQNQLSFIRIVSSKKKEFKDRDRFGC